MKSLRSGLLAFAFALLPAIPLSAQGFGAGVKAGIASATFYGDDVEDAESRTAFWGGGFLTFQLSPMFAIQPELLYASKGAAGTGGINDEVSAEFRIGYIDVPILAKFTVGTDDARPYFLAGPSVGIRVSCEVEASNAAVTLTVDCDEFEDGVEISSTDFGGVVGAGFDYDMGRATLSVDGRVSLGLTSIAAGDSDADVKHRTFAFLAGVRIPLGARP